MIKKITLIAALIGLLISCTTNSNDVVDRNELNQNRTIESFVKTYEGSIDDIKN